MGIGAEIQNNTPAVRVYPAFRNNLTTAEVAEIYQRISEGISFWMYYDLLQNEWHTSTTTITGVPDIANLPFVYAPPITNGGGTEIYSDWASSPQSGLVYIDIAAQSNHNYL